MIEIEKLIAQLKVEINKVDSSQLDVIQSLIDDVSTYVEEMKELLDNDVDDFRIVLEQASSVETAQLFINGKEVFSIKN